MKDLAILLISVLASVSLHAGLFIVNDKSATVYLDGNKTGTLKQGEIIDGAWLPGDEWVAIQRDGRTFKVRRQNLRSREDVNAAGKKQLLELEAREKQLKQDYALLMAERNQLAQLGINTQRDLGVVVVFPGVRVSQVPTTTVANSRYGRSVAVVPRISVQPEEVATLTERQARRVFDKIEEREEEISAAIKVTSEKLVRASAEVVAAKLQLQRKQDRFDRFELFPDDYLRDTFIVLSDRVPVYRDVNQVGTLRRQQVISASLSPRDREWVIIEDYEGGAAKVRAKHLGAKQQLMTKNAAELQRMTLAAELADNDVDLLLLRKQTLQAAINDLGVLIERRDQYVELDPDKLAQRRNERVLPVPVGAIESANVHQAKKQIREFEKQLDEVNPKLNETRNRVLQLRKRLVDLETREKNLEAAFARP